jgi:ectoine hydroxylase-related dioxygenase (phytanoyl-CoA dioxygenase family)
MAMNKVKNFEPFEVSNQLIAQPQKLKQRADEKGYLFFRNLLPEDAVFQLRKEVLEVCRKHGFLDESAPLMEGVSAPGFYIIESSTNPDYTNYYKDIQQLHAFHALAHHRNLLTALDSLFGGETFVHPLKILRTIFPAAQNYTTPPHQDYYHVRGTEETWTSWIPLGDCKKELGGLAVVPGSHHWGLLPERPAKGAGLISIDVPEDALWVTGEFKAGDVLMFHSHTVHQGIDNDSKNKIRLSMDCRFQAMEDRKIGPVSIRSPHLHCIDWEGVYKNWPADDSLKYYWKDLDLEVDYSAPPTIGTPENPHPVN